MQREKRISFYSRNGIYDTRCRFVDGELDETSVGFSDKSTGGRKSKIYNLDMILSVGYRVNSRRGIAFRKWANNVLKQFIMKG